jgi:hypothetical protein
LSGTFSCFFIRYVFLLFFFYFSGVFGQPLQRKASFTRKKKEMRDFVGAL